MDYEKEFAVGECVKRAQNVITPLAERHRAFGELVARFQDMAFGSAYAILGGNHTRAEEAAQEAFVVAWSHLHQLHTPDAFPGWLRQIVVRQAGRAVRRSQATVPFADFHEAVGQTSEEPHTIATRRERNAQVQEAIAALPPSERDVIFLFYWNENTREEVAAYLGLSQPQVKKRLASARARLKGRLWTMIEADFSEGRPSHSTQFADKVLAFTKLFSGLVNNGQSLTRSLDELAENETNPDFSAAIRDITARLREGEILSTGMKRYPQYFADEYVAAIHEGEYGGCLEVSLEKLASGTYVRGGIFPNVPSA